MTANQTSEMPNQQQGNYQPNLVSRVLKVAKDYAPWVIGGVLIGAGAGYGFSLFNPPEPAPFVYVPHIAQDIEYASIGALGGGSLGAIVKYVKNRVMNQE